MTYPFFTLDQPSIENMEMFISIETFDQIDKYRNVQFLLHMCQLFGLEKVMLFLTNFIYDDSELFIK